VRFGLLGSIVQIEPDSEGYLLWQADLLDKGQKGQALSRQKGQALSSAFSKSKPHITQKRPPPLDELCV